MKGGVPNLVAGVRLVSASLRWGARSPGRMVRLVRKGGAALRRGGIREVRTRLLAYAARYSERLAYDDWVRRHDTLTNEDRQAIRERIGILPYTPVISVLMPVYDAPEAWLRVAIESVAAQLYPHWELCIADDASRLPHVRRVLEEYRARDARIKVRFRERNGHIAEASNTALELAGGEFVALLDHDDVLAEHALYMVVEELNRCPEADLIYSDEDKIDGRGRRSDPYFKPDWSPDLFCSQNVVNHLGVYRGSLVRRIGGFRKGYEGSQDYDLALRVSEHTAGSKVRHIPHVLYHWRAAPGSAAVATEAKPYAIEAAGRAVQEHLARRGVPARVERAAGGFHKVTRAVPDPPPLVSLLIPTKDRVELLCGCVEGIFGKTDYPNLEVVIVDNDSRQPKTLAYLEDLERDPRVRVLRYPGPFNFSAVNNLAARSARGELLGLLNNDLQVISSDWLQELVSHAVRPEVGAVGAMLYYPDDTIQHAGVILGIGGVAGHPHRYEKRGIIGYGGRAAVVQNFSAVTAACMVLRRAIFEEVGGFDEDNLAVAFNDVDLCLRIRERGYLIVWTPNAELYHVESASRGPDDTPAQHPRFVREMGYMQRRWGAVLTSDPYYNPNLSLRDEDFSLASPPRVRKPWMPQDEERRGVLLGA